MITPDFKPDSSYASKKPTKEMYQEQALSDYHTNLRDLPSTLANENSLMNQLWDWFMSTMAANNWSKAIVYVCPVTLQPTISQDPIRGMVWVCNLYSGNPQTSWLLTNRLRTLKVTHLALGGVLYTWG